MQASGAGGSGCRLRAAWGRCARCGPASPGFPHPKRPDQSEDGDDAEAGAEEAPNALAAVRLEAVESGELELGAAHARGLASGDGVHQAVRQSSQEEPGAQDSEVQGRLDFLPGAPPVSLIRTLQPQPLSIVEVPGDRCLFKKCVVYALVVDRRRFRTAVRAVVPHDEIAADGCDLA
jgi:hypothetical protein